MKKSILLGLTILLSTVLVAQIVDTGRITGVVQDTSGGIIPSAEVTLRNVGTGLASHITTDAKGSYVSPPLSPGDYEVEVKAEGFGTVVEHIHLEVAQRAARADGDAANEPDVPDDLLARNVVGGRDEHRWSPLAGSRPET